MAFFPVIMNNFSFSSDHSTRGLHNCVYVSLSDVLISFRSRGKWKICVIWLSLVIWCGVVWCNVMLCDDRKKMPSMSKISYIFLRMYVRTYYLRNRVTFVCVRVCVRPFRHSSSKTEEVKKLARYGTVP